MELFVEGTTEERAARHRPRYTHTDRTVKDVGMNAVGKIDEDWEMCENNRRIANWKKRI